MNFLKVPEQMSQVAAVRYYNAVIEIENHQLFVNGCHIHVNILQDFVHTFAKYTIGTSLLWIQSRK